MTLLKTNRGCHGEEEDEMLSRGLCNSSEAQKIHYFLCTVATVQDSFLTCHNRIAANPAQSVKKTPFSFVSNPQVTKLHVQSGKPLHDPHFALWNSPAHCLRLYCAHLSLFMQLCHSPAACAVVVSFPCTVIPGFIFPSPHLVVY